MKGKRKNGPERMLQEYMESKGFEVSKRGWPDFICLKDGEVVCVEVKRNERNRLKREQLSVMEILSDAGFRCLRWDPVLKFTNFDSDIPISEEYLKF